MALTPERSSTGDCSLLERDGLEGVSFRKIAAELDVSAPHPLWHVDNKRRLLDLMAEDLMARGPPTSRSPAARRGLGRLAGATHPVVYKTLISHRDAPRVAAGNRPTVAALPRSRPRLGTLIDAGFEPGDAFEIHPHHRRLHHRLRARVAGRGRRASSSRRTDSALADELRSGRLPYVDPAAFPQHAQRGTHHHSPHDQMFEHGLA